MSKLTLKCSATTLLDFFKSTVVDLPQTLLLDGDTMTSRFYPRSKAYILQRKISGLEINPKPQSITWAVASLQKHAKILETMKGSDIVITMNVTGSLIDKISIKNKTTNINLISGSLDVTPPPLPEDIWGRLSNVEQYEAKFTITGEEISRLASFHDIMGGSTSTSKNQRIASIKVVGGKAIFSSADVSEEKNHWSFECGEECEVNGLDEKDRKFNLNNIIKLNEKKSYTVYITKHQETTKLMVITSGEDTNMVLVNIINEN